MLFKGKGPSFWSTKFIGLFLVSIGILVFAHINYVTEITDVVSKIYDVTLKDLTETFNLIQSGSKFVSPGGGIIGCSLAVLFNMLFAITGTKIVS